jgi:hypothetical protein
MVTAASDIQPIERRHPPHEQLPSVLAFFCVSYYITLCDVDSSSCHMLSCLQPFVKDIVVKFYSPASMPSIPGSLPSSISIAQCRFLHVLLSFQVLSVTVHLLSYVVRNVQISKYLECNLFCIELGANFRQHVVG